jgi:hypothetical protein
MACETEVTLALAASGRNISGFLESATPKLHGAVTLKHRCLDAAGQTLPKPDAETQHH